MQKQTSLLYFSIMHQFSVWVLSGLCLLDLHCVLRARTHTVSSLDAELFALPVEAAGKSGSACMQVFDADALILCQASGAFYLQQSWVQRASTEPEIAQRRGEGEGWMCSSGMETRVSCYRIIISLQSPPVLHYGREHTLLAAAGPQRFTLMCVCKRQEPFTPVFIVRPPENTPTDVMETGFPTAANTSVHSSSDYFWWMFATSESLFLISGLKDLS